MQLTSSLSKLLFATMAMLFVAVDLLLGGVQTTGHPRRSFIRRPTVSSLLESTPEPRRGHTAIWTGREMIIWGGVTANGISRSGSRYDPMTDSWGAMADAPIGLSSHMAVWTGREMIVWGGITPADSRPVDTNMGARYDPVTDSWTLISISAAPTTRGGETAVWTGKEMIVWGGGSDGNVTKTGARYDPITDSWTPMSTSRSPAARRSHVAVWTGTEMIIWGGQTSRTRFANSGGRYNPVTDTWNSIRRPSVDSSPTTCGEGAWIDEFFLIVRLKTASKYDPTTNRWTSTAAPPGYLCGWPVIWTGTEVLVWKGDTGYISDITGEGYRYDPTLDEWTLMNTDGAPAARAFSSTVWTGTEMIVWGGANFEFHLYNSGGRYNPVDDSWTPTSVE